MSINEMQSPGGDQSQAGVEGALTGIRVLDLTAMMAGPCCSRWLSDLGAEVIKLEPPEGDYMRTRAPTRQGVSSYYGHLNAGKQCIAVDLKSPEGLAIAKDLALKCDVFLEAFRPGVMDRLGLGAEVLRTANPRLVYCSISGFGQNNSASGFPAYAPVVHAASGFEMANFEYQDGAEKPANSGIPLADMFTSVFAAFSIQTALLHRVKTGVGCAIDVNLMDSMMNVLVYEIQAAQSPVAGRRPLYKPLLTQDGFVLVAPVNEKNFQSVCVATGHPEWRDDPLLNSDRARFKNWSEYMARIESWTSTRSSADCERIMMQAGVPCSRYRKIEDVMTDPQFEERGSFGSVTDSQGSYKTMNLPFTFDGVKPEVRKRIASIGEDTSRVLASVLGLPQDQIQELTKNRIVVQG